jgi:hypothetical protein
MSKATLCRKCGTVRATSDWRPQVPMFSPPPNDYDDWQTINKSLVTCGEDKTIVLALGSEPHVHGLDGKDELSIQAIFDESIVTADCPYGVPGPNNSRASTAIIAMRQATVEFGQQQKTKYHDLLRTLFTEGILLNDLWKIVAQYCVISSFPVFSVPKVPWYDLSKDLKAEQTILQLKSGLREFRWRDAKGKQQHFVLSK